MSLGRWNTISAKQLVGFQMYDDRGPIARQGTNDGLCGIYCLINAVRNDERLEGSSGEDLLRYFLEAANRLNNFLPSKMSDGYEQHELVDIFNEFSRCLDLRWRAHLLTTIKRSFLKHSALILAKRIFEEGGELVLHGRDVEHWFLAYTYDFEKNCYLVEDSDLTQEQHCIAPTKLRDFGVVILPSDSALSRAH